LFNLTPIVVSSPVCVISVVILPSPFTVTLEPSLFVFTSLLSASKRRPLLISSFLASAAALKKEFTLPTVSQTVICTRIEGRTPVPEKESLESLAKHRASMAIFLSVHMIDKVVETLATSYPMTTPVAVVQRASWPDQKIVLGTLETIEQKVKEARINKTAQILVGDFLGDEYEKSKLYDKYFTHEYREAVKK